MTFIRFRKEQARNIIFDRDPGYRVIAYEQEEYGKGIYRYRTIIRELRTGKYFVADYQGAFKPIQSREVLPFDQDEPVFREIDMDMSSFRAIEPRTLTHPHVGVRRNMSSAGCSK